MDRLHAFVHSEVTVIVCCSKIAGSVKMRPGRGSSKRPPRPPASAKTLEPLPEVRLLSITGCTSLQKVLSSPCVQLV